jgi:ferritin-like metal-binding protein YciE
MELHHQAPEEETTSLLSHATPAEVTLEANSTLLQPPERMLARLRKRNPVRKMAEAFWQGEKIGQEEVRELLRRAAHSSASRWRERVVATWLLGHLPLNEDQHAEAIRILSNTAEKSHKQDRWRIWGRFCLRSPLMLWGVIIPLGGLEVLINRYIPALQDFWKYLSDWTEILLRPYGNLMEMLVPIVTSPSPFESAFGITLLLILLPAPITLPLSRFIDRKRQNQVRKEAISSLLQRGDMKALAPLLVILKQEKGEVFEAALRAALELLPRLNTTHYGTLRSDVTQNLCYLLEHFEGTIIYSLLEALEKVGDSRALPTVLRLERSLKDPLLRNKLSQLLPILVEREQQEKQSKDLLRSSQEPISKETLLRPASPQAEIEIKDLLRPSDL